jgi:uncharacterized protein (TIGR03000 family)
MLKQWLATATLGVLGLVLSPGVSSAQLGSMPGNVSGIYSGPNYSAYRSGGYGPGYYSRPYYSSPDYYTPSYYYTPAVSAPANVATIDIRVPANAEIWFDGEKTSQTGTQRRFTSPTLPPDRSFTYEIRARWTGDDGKPVEQKREVKVQANRTNSVDFLAR